MATKDISDIQVLRAQKRAKEEQWCVFGYEILGMETGQCKKVCYRALDRAYRRGLLDYGVSLRTAWLTDKGHALLDAKEKEAGI